MLIAWGWLLSWAFFHQDLNCLLNLLFLVPVTGLIALSMFEHALLRRRALLNMYLRRERGLYQILKGGFFMLLWSICKALVFSVFLLLEALAWQFWIWLLLALDVVLLRAVQAWLAKTLESQVKSGYTVSLARNALVPFNTLIFALILTAAAFHLPQNDYRDMSLSQAVHYEVTRVQTNCAGSAVLERLAAAKNAAAWWFAQKWLSRESLKRGTALGGWLLFLLSSTAFMWAYSRLLSGATVSLETVFTFDPEETSED